nr:protein FAM117B-like [Globicephala melas]
MSGVQGLGGVGSGRLPACLPPSLRDASRKGILLTSARAASAPRLAGCCARGAPGPPPRARAGGPRPPPPPPPPPPPRAAAGSAGRSRRSRRGAGGGCSAPPTAAPPRRSPAPESRLLKFHTTSVCSSSTILILREESEGIKRIHHRRQGRDGFIHSTTVCGHQAVSDTGQGAGIQRRPATSQRLLQRLNFDPGIEDNLMQSPIGPVMSADMRHEQEINLCYSEA